MDVSSGSMMASILVTGGAGFIGTNLCQYLHDNGHHVISMDRVESTGTPWQEIQEDIRNDFEIEGIEVIVHLAAQISVPQSIIDPDETLSINVEGTKNILRIAELSGVERIIFASSAAVYGDAEEIPIAENCPMMPQSPYAVSKILGEELMRMSQLKTCSMRFFNVYGGGQSADGGYAAVIPAFKKAIKNNNHITIFGDGTQIRDFIHVSDLVKLIEIAILSDDPPLEVNIASGQATSLLDLVAVLKSINPLMKEPVFVDERQGDIHTSMADISLLKQRFSFEKMVTLLEGLS
ncbi:MAG TPA: NAD-dependent epimerase/dehydratase family protein [Candidatus Poseidoniales archaeon]|jgi:nucleoside-diphosphate-sugar epimerase|nr:NAD-dependent epimerase/dehydratase family protein [Candidatus Poseidoniales archaeon]